MVRRCADLVSTLSHVHVYSSTRVHVPARRTLPVPVQYMYCSNVLVLYRHCLSAYSSCEHRAFYHFHLPWDAILPYYFLREWRHFKKFPLNTVHYEIGSIAQAPAGPPLSPSPLNPPSPHPPYKTSVLGGTFSICLLEEFAEK